MISDNRLNFNYHQSIEESLNLISRKWNLPIEIIELQLGRRQDVVDKTIEIGGITFHIPRLEIEGVYVLWKCLWPDCQNCCEGQHKLPLTMDDVNNMTKSFGYDSKTDFIKNETLISSSKHHESFGFVDTIRTELVLKRNNYETDADAASVIKCRFLFDTGCGIQNCKPGVCSMYPFAPYFEYDYNNSTLAIHTKFQFTGDCPGFYLAKKLDNMMPIFESYSKKIYDYMMAYARTKRKNYCAASSIDLTKYSDA